MRRRLYRDPVDFVWRDVIFAVLASLGFLVILILVYWNPPADEMDKDIISPGSLSFEISWPKEIDADIDLWIMDPTGDKIGYDNIAGKYLNLVRDDRGHREDPLGLNYESTFSRGIAEGEWIVNVAYYAYMVQPDLRDPSGRLVARNDTFNNPEVTVTLLVTRHVSPDHEVIAKEEITLTYVRQELTMVRFKTDSDGKFIKGSINYRRCLVWLSSDIESTPKC